MGNKGPEARSGLARGCSNPKALGNALSVDLPGLLRKLAQSFILLLVPYALWYLGLIFNLVQLALGLLSWCCQIHSLRASHLCRVGGQKASHAAEEVCLQSAWLCLFPDTERVE